MSFDKFSIICSDPSPISRLLLQLVQAISQKVVPRGLPRVVWMSRRFLLGQGIKRILFRNRFHVCCDTDSYYSVMFACGIANRHLDSALKLLLRPGAVFFDIGANVGTISLLACSAIKDSREITAHCFEPGPSAFTWLSKNCSLNNFDIVLNESAVGAENGEATLTLGTVHSHSTLAPEPPGGFTFLSKVGQKVVPLISLDSYCHVNNVVPTIIKIDVEGYETEVIRGGEKILQEAKPLLIVEINPMRLLAVGSSHHHLVTTLQQAGYRLFHLDPVRGNKYKDRDTWHHFSEAFHDDAQIGEAIDVVAVHSEELIISR